MRGFNETTILEIMRLEKLSFVSIVRGLSEGDRVVEFVVFLSHFSVGLKEHIRDTVETSGLAEVKGLSGNDAIHLLIACGDLQETEVSVKRLADFLIRCSQSRNAV